jgi:hypothetical protein
MNDSHSPAEIRQPHRDVIEYALRRMKIEKGARVQSDINLKTD